LSRALPAFQREEAYHHGNRKEEGILELIVYYVVKLTCVVGTVSMFLLFRSAVFAPGVELYEVAVTILASWLLTERLFACFIIYETEGEEGEDEQN